jgi:hypothetical protein
VNEQIPGRIRATNERSGPDGMWERSV